MKSRRLISKMLTLVLTSLMIILSPNLKTHLATADEPAARFFVVGEFLSGEGEEEIELRKVVGNDKQYATYKHITCDKDGGTTFDVMRYDTKKKKYDKTMIDNNGDIKGPGTYKITYDLNSGTNGTVTVEEVSKAKQGKYYIKGDFNGYKATDPLIDLGDNKYKISGIHTTKNNEKFFIEYNGAKIKSENKNSFNFGNEGNYTVTLDMSKTEDQKRLTIEDEGDLSGLDKYYVVGPFNNYKKDVTSLMRKNDDGTFEFDITTTDKNTQFYIANGNDSYKSEGLNQGTNFLIKNKGTYTITFKESPYKVTWDEKEGTNMYLIGIDSSTKDNYSKMERVSNGKYEMEVKVNRETLFYFVDDVDNEYHDVNGKDYVLPTLGTYNITITIKNGTHSVVIENMDEEEAYHKYYLLGNFNNYILSEDYALELNEDEKEYIEFRIELDLRKGDEFYISDGKKVYKKPNKENVKIEEDGRYEIFFSKDYDYGNDYHLSWKLMDEKEDEIEIIEINSKEDLLEVIENCKIDNYSLNKSFELTKDIDLEGMAIEPIQILRGEFNGNYHQIKNFSLIKSTNGNEMGFIRKTTSEASIRNLILDYDIETKEKKTVIGSIVGINYGKIYNSTFNGELRGINIVGGIAGSNEETGEIIKCKNNANVIGKTIVGGITGINKGLVKDSMNNGLINQIRMTAADENKVSNIGGIAGLNEGTINHSTNNNTIGIKQVGNFIGGISGSNVGEVKNCINNSLVNGNKYVGGIVGYYAEFVDNSADKHYNTTMEILKEVLKEYDKNIPEIEEDDDKPEIEDKEDIVTSFKYNINNGNIYAEANVGGLAGYASSESDKKDLNKDAFNVLLSINEGNVTANNNYAGGVVGNHAKGEIKECYNTGEIKANNNYVGGISGYSNGTISYSYNISMISGEDYVGGISGSAKEIHDTYSITSITTEGSFAGAITGYMNKIDNKTYHNYFVFEDYNGIDNINYKDKAEAVKRTDLATKEMLGLNLDKRYYSVDSEHKSYPYLRMMIDDKHDNLLVKEFNRKLEKTNSFNCIVTFLDEDSNTVSKVYVPYGEDFNIDDLPAIEEKEFNFARWEDFDMKNITEDKYINVVYEEIITSIASDVTASPRLIVEGKFYDTTRVELVPTNNDYLIKDTNYTNLGSYMVRVIDKDHDISNNQITVKFKMPSDTANIAFINNGNLIFIDFIMDGDYATFEIGEEQEFILLEKEYYSFRNPKFVASFATSIVGAVVITTGVIVGVTVTSKKFKNRPKKTKLSKSEKKALKEQKKALKDKEKEE